MKRLGLVAVLLSLAAPVFAQVDAKVEKELQASYKKVNAMLKKKDITGVMSMMTPDATTKEMGETKTRAQFEQSLKQNIAGLDLQSASIKFKKVVVKGGLAMTDYTEAVKATMVGPDGKPNKMEITSVYKTTFKKVGGDWKMHRSETLGTPVIRLNGKPFNLGAPGG